MEAKVKSIFDADKLFDKLVVNALDFLRHASDELEKQPKYSVVHFCTGLELFLKARLMCEHWSLVVVKIDEADYKKFEKGDFQSVSITQALERLKKIAGETFSKDEEKAYHEVRNHRNQVMHFFPVKTTPRRNEEETSSIVAEQCLAWHFLDIRLQSIWSDQFGKYSMELRSIREKIHKNRSYLKFKFNRYKPHIDAIKADGAEIIDCDICDFTSVEVKKQIEPLCFKHCYVCENAFLLIRVECPECQTPVFLDSGDGENCTNCDNVIDLKVLLSLYGPDEDPKEESETAYCEDCGYNSDKTVIPWADQFLCLNCLDTFFRIEQCGYCHERVAGINYVDSIVFGCMLCRNAINWDS